MGEFIAAVLSISVLWITWDLLKLLIREKEKCEPSVDFITGPGKEKIQKMADSFHELAKTFQSMPCEKERLSNQDIRDIFCEVQMKSCRECNFWDNCWEKGYQNTYKRSYEVLAAIEEEGEELSEQRKQEFYRYCVRGKSFLDEMQHAFTRARLNLMWTNRLMENRAAVAQQLTETAEIVQKIADNLYDVKVLEESLKERIKDRLKLKFVLVRELWMPKDGEERAEIFITMRSLKRRCIPTKDIAEVLTEIFGQAMVPAVQSRTIINKEYSTVQFVPDTEFVVLKGVARVTREGEMMSGDNFGFLTKDNGQLIMSLSDGMGSGFGAAKESGTVIELLEQFMDAGFGKETAVRMINSALVLQRGVQMFSTLDMCSVDLHNGDCELLKIGASTTFIRKKEQVESITSTSLPVGTMQTVDFECTSKKLEAGDFIIMVSDGVMDALPQTEGEEIMKGLIREIQTSNARDFAKTLMERVLFYQHCRALDDMTILVGCMWYK